ncbi:MAG: hypothetical protein JWN86_2399 [Planctomycetota bacterium]|nr:hypothetical protein [Planctomycetota bacterium]
MKRSPGKRGRRWFAAGFILAVMGAAGAIGWYCYPSRRWDGRLEAIPRVPVHRADLNFTLRAGGSVESSLRTMIACELENLQFSNEGRVLGAGGRSTILEIIPDGSNVRTNQVLCRLDSSEYEELVRQQEIKLQQARNDKVKAELDVKAAEIALREYRDGLLPDQLQNLDGKILLAEVERSRQTDRLDWSRTMLKNGYVSQGQFNTETQRLLAADIALNGLRGQRMLLTKFQSPNVLRNFQVRVDGSLSMLEYQDLRLRRNETLMAKFRRQVELCTIRAPHDGFLIYANAASNANRVEVGTQVYQKMNLFYLPDLTKMEVQAVLNESVVDRVRAKQTVRVRIDGLPNYELEGDVVSIDSLPIVRRDIPGGTDVKNYMGRIRLRTAPRGLLPGMTAEVEIQTAHSMRALVIPSESLVVEDGKDYCYVASAEGLERREVHIGQGTRDLLEIRSGLEEGEEVIRDPSLLEVSELEQATVHTAPAHEPHVDSHALAPAAR